MTKIIVVGGGAGGLELATKLGRTLGRKRRAEITLVDKNSSHLWKPLLHEVASGSLDASANEINYRAHARKHHYEFQLGRMTGLDRTAKDIVIAAFHDEEGNEVVPERRIQYDTLVIAVGSTANDFGTPGAQDHCLFLDSLRQARRFHNLMLNAFLRKNHEALQGKPHALNISIIGAGATGVELAAELRLASRELPVYGMNHLQSSDVSISVIEAADRILPALPGRLSAAATRELEKQKVTVLTGQPVNEVRQNSLVMQDGTELPSEMTIWAAGIKAPAFLAGLEGLEANRSNQLVVEQTLQTTNDADIFAFGDCAACPQPDSNRPVPPRAQAAHQQADALFKTLCNRLEGKEAVAFHLQRPRLTDQLQQIHHCWQPDGQPVRPQHVHRGQGGQAVLRVPVPDAPGSPARVCAHGHYLAHGQNQPGHASAFEAALRLFVRTGAGDGNRTHVICLGSRGSTIELRPPA